MTIYRLLYESGFDGNYDGVRKIPVSRSASPPRLTNRYQYRGSDNTRDAAARPAVPAVRGARAMAAVAAAAG